MDWETRERPGRCADASRGRRQGSEACRGSWATEGGDEAKVGGEKNSADRGAGSPRTPAGGAARLNTRVANSPADDLLGLSPDEVLFLRGQNAQGELLARPALPIHHVRALVHVDGALWEGCGLQEEDRAGVTVGAEGTSLSPQVLPDPPGFSTSTGASQLCRSPCHAEHGGGLP